MQHKLRYTEKSTAKHIRVNGRKGKYNMKCERCGHELDNDDLFCSKCGKAVFEEYMDEDDIWEFYKATKS